MDKRTIRNVIVFILISLTSGWLGLLIDKNIGAHAEGDSPGMGIWLVLPLLTTLILRLFAGDGWKDIGLKLNLKGNVKWYIVSLLIFPLVTLFILIIGKLFGWIDFSNFRLNAYFTGFASTLLVNFIKNIFEESVWRGYLTSKLLKLKQRIHGFT